MERRPLLVGADLSSSRSEPRPDEEGRPPERIMASVPRIGAFYGIVIYMYWREHPPAHFHAIYGDFEAAIAFDDGRVLAGELPVRAHRLAREWAELRREALEANWRRAQELLPLEQIGPLP